MRKEAHAKIKASKVLWALDALSDDESRLKEGAKSAQALGKLWDRPVEPVFILTPDGLHALQEESDELQSSQMPRLRRALASMAEKYGDASFLEPKILMSKSGGKKKELKTLLDYAKKNGSAPLVLTTHGRSGLSRWVAGSFTETALLASHTPLLVVPPEHQLKHVKVALFPTNFSRASKFFINKQIPWLKENSIKLVLYHRLINAVDPFIQSGLAITGGGWVSFESMRQEEALKRQKEGDRMIQKFQEQGVDAKFLMSSSLNSLEHGVLEAAEAENVDLIALLTESDALNANLMGSLARQLVRSAPCPLWIQHR